MMDNKYDDEIEKISSITKFIHSLKELKRDINIDDIFYDGQRKYLRRDKISITSLEFGIISLEQAIELHYKFNSSFDLIAGSFIYIENGEQKLAEYFFAREVSIFLHPISYMVDITEESIADIITFLELKQMLYLNPKIYL